MWFCIVGLLDKDIVVVSQNEKFPVLNDCRLGRFENVKLSNLIFILDKDKLLVPANDKSPVVIIESI